MGFFKSREEKEAEREQRRIEAEKIAQTVNNSPITKYLQRFLMEQFGDLNSEETIKLRELSNGGGRAGYIMTVRYDGILFDLINRSGESLDKWAITFDALGCSNLPSTGVDALQKILLQTLSEIPHLMVLDTGFFMYNKNCAKQSW